MGSAVVVATVQVLIQPDQPGRVTDSPGAASAVPLERALVVLLMVDSPPLVPCLQLPVAGLYSAWKANEWLYLVAMDSLLHAKNDYYVDIVDRF